MAGIRQIPYPSKFVVDKQGATGDKTFSTHFRYKHLLSAAGPTAQSYTDLTEFARNFFAPYSKTLSEGKTPFLEFLKGTSGFKEIETNEVRWRHYGEPQRKFYSIGNPQPSTDHIGAAGARFKIRMDVDHFEPSDQVAPCENMRAIIIIQSYARKIAGGFEYEAELQDKNTFLPAAYLKTGALFSRAGQAASYLSPLTGRAGTSSFNTGFAYVEFGIPLSQTTKAYSIDEETHLREGSFMMACAYDDKNMVGGITTKIEMEAKFSMEKEIERSLLFDEMYRDGFDPKSKKPITRSPGLYSYLEESNILYYDPKTNSIDMILDIIDSYWYDRVATNQRNLVLMTGHGGLKTWHEWVTEKFGQQPVQVDHNFVLGSADAWDSSKKGYKLGNYQFTKYEVQPFGSVAVGYMPELDDTLVDGRYMPGTNYTVRSFEFMAFDWGNGGEQNIQLLRRKGKDRDLVVPGTWSPWGAVGLNNPYFKTVGDASIGDAYEVRMTRSFGLMVGNTEKLLLFRPQV